MSERSKKNETKHFPIVYKATTPTTESFLFEFTNFGRDRVKDTNSDGPDSVCNKERFFLDLCLEYLYVGKIEQE